MKTKRRKETDAQREERRRREAMRQAKRRASESPQQRQIRRQKDAERKARQRQNIRIQKSHLHSDQFALHLEALSLMPKKQSNKCRKKGGKAGTFLQCSVCMEFIEGKSYVCVQCAALCMCASCEACNAHPHHYVLRVPSFRSSEEIIAMVEKIRYDLNEGFHMYTEDESVESYCLEPCESKELVEIECDPLPDLESEVSLVNVEDMDSSQNTWQIVKNYDEVTENCNESTDFNNFNAALGNQNIPTVKLKKRKHDPARTKKKEPSYLNTELTISNEESPKLKTKKRNHNAIILNSNPSDTETQARLGTSENIKIKNDIDENHACTKKKKKRRRPKIKIE